jgi:hypothetical protein
MNSPLNPLVSSSIPVVPLSIGPVVHANGHLGSSEVARQRDGVPIRDGASDLGQAKT